MALGLAHLELLAALAENGTLGAAANAVNISPSAASRRLRDAGQRVGATLVVAEGRSITLTPAGQVLADAAMETVRQLGEAELTARWLDQGSVRPIRLGVSFHDRLGWALDLENHPVELTRTDDASWPRGLRDRHVDLVINAGSEPITGLARTRLADDRLVAVVPSGHPLVSRDAPVEAEHFQSEAYLASDTRPRSGFEFENLFRPAAISPLRIVRVESLATIIDLVRAGAGLSIQPALCLAPLDPIAGVATIPLDRDIPVEWWAHHRPDPEVHVVDFCALLQERFESAAAAGS